MFFIANVNLIGAYIVTFLLLAILSKRPKAPAIEKFLNAGSGAVSIALAGCMTAMSGNLIFYNLQLSIPSLLELFSFPTDVLSGLSLWIHEAGHIYFIWGGPLLHSLGGTLNEIIFPLAVATWAGMQRCYRLAGLALLCLSFNSIGIGRYMQDARSRSLPLFGVTDKEGHDWYNILGTLDLLEYDHALAYCTWGLGMVVFLFGCGLMLTPDRFLPPRPRVPSADTPTL